MVDDLDQKSSDLVPLLVKWLQKQGDRVIELEPGSTFKGENLEGADKVRAVVFGDSIPFGVRERASFTWLVTQGQAPFRSMIPRGKLWTAEPPTQKYPDTYLVDLDPAQTADVQVQCLVAALRYQDEEPAVVYRGDQRFVPRSLEKSSTGASAKPASWTREELEALPLGQRRAWLEKHLRAEFKVIAGLDLAPADMERPLQALGLDSLMAIQFRNRLDANLGIALSVVDFLKGLSLNQVVENTLRQVAADGAMPTSNKPTPAVDLTPAVATENLDKLSERELDRMLQALLE